jgi:uncharacterized membrane protein
MNNSSLHPLACDYLKRLKKAAANLPRSRRNELIGEIEAHLSEALPAGASETEALNVLERLGEPAEIVAEAGTGQALAPQAGLNEWLAISLLLLGGFALIIGWCVGVALLWNSRIWTLRDKLIGTFVVPGGLAGVFLAAAIPLTVSSSSSSTGVVTCTTRSGRKCDLASGGSVTHSGPSHFWELAALIALVSLPFLTSIYLTWRANRLSSARFR